MKKQTKRMLVVVLVLILLVGVAFAGWKIYDSTVDRSGWILADGNRYYADAHGDYLTGWQMINHEMFYFGPDGAAQIGWFTQQEETYYFDANGVMLSGKQMIQGREYWFDDSGKLITQWYSDGVNTYYFDEQNNPVTGFATIDGDSYFFDNTGIMQTGWVTLDTGSRYFGEDGAMATGWTEINGVRYCFDPEGERLTGWQEIDGKEYCLNEDGTVCSGWIDRDGQQVYVTSDGSLASGPVEIDGQLYYFNPHGVHVLLVNPWNMLPEDYEVELKSIGGGYQVSVECYDALMEMLDACHDAGNAYYLCSAYRTMDDQEYLYNRLVGKFQNLGYSYENALERAATQVAIPGTSEHQLGLAVDIVSAYNIALNETQEDTATQKWLMEHCWEYGFILRYPTEKTDITGIIYEPWHYRYVGVEIAMEIRDMGICLEEYLGAVVQ